MGFRNPGPNTSQNPQPVVPAAGQYTAEDHSWESVTFQQGRPPTDWEMNLMQEALGAYGFRRHLHRLMPSVFLTGGFLEGGSVASSLTFLSAISANSNKFQMPAADVFVNGWMLRYELTELSTAGLNQFTMPAPPLSGTRTDLIVLEVWRANVLPSGVTPPSGQTTGLSAANQIFRFGNAKAPDSPVNVNLANDLIDPAFLQETSRRVQIQYRYRVIQGITSLTATPDGFDDPAVFANTVPFMNASGLDGQATTLTYSKHPIDPGLWVAGNGDQPGVTALGTEDGNMYAIPMFAVFRRNSGGFNRATNLNGGVFITAGTSDRPDGLFADQIVAGDVKDLRKSMAWDLTEIRDRTFQELLDNNLASEHEITQNAVEGPPFIGPGGTSFTVRDNIGTNSHPGNTDSVRMNFSDRSITESVVCKAQLLAGATSATFSLSNLPVWWSASGINLLATSPTGVDIVGLGQVRLVTVATTSDIDLTLSSSTPHIKSAVMSTSIGPGVDQLVITFSSALGNAATLFAEIQIEYPSGFGVRRNLLPNSDGTSGTAVWTPPALNVAGWFDGTTTSVTSDVQRFALSRTYWWMDPAHRELSMRLKTIAQAGTFYAADTLSFYIPEIVTGTVSVNDGTNSYTTTNYSFNTSYTKVILSFPVATGTPLTVTYTGLRGAPPVSAAPGDSYQVFYTTRAIQSVVVPSGQQTLQLFPRSISGDMFVLSSGSGSPDTGFPFLAPSSQLPVALLPAATFPEAALDTPAALNIIGFGANTGFLKVPALVPYLPDPQQVQLFKDAPDVTADADGRNFWPKSQLASPGAQILYSPQVFGQTLQFKQRHKTAYPVLMELKQDFQGIGRKGTFVLVVFTRWTDYDSQNSIVLAPTVGDTGAAVYRIRGNLLNPRRVTP